MPNRNQKSPLDMPLNVGQTERLIIDTKVSTAIVTIVRYSDDVIIQDCLDTRDAEYLKRVEEGDEICVFDPDLPRLNARYFRVRHGRLEIFNPHANETVMETLGLADMTRRILLGITTSVLGGYVIYVFTG